MTKKTKEPELTGKPKYACSNCGVKVRELHDLEFCRSCFNKRHTIIGRTSPNPRIVTKSKSVTRLNKRKVFKS